MSKQSTWDAKASTYNRYSSKKNTFEQRVMHLVKEAGVDFKKATVLDIGCGTGVYTLHLAKEAKYIDALDFSKEMLSVLEEDAASLHVNTIKTIHDSWEGFTCKEKYDIAFCSMSPALKEPKDFKKMHECAKQKVFLGWAGVRESSLHDDIFKAFGESYKAPRGALDLKLWLDEEGIDYTMEVLKETRSVRKEYDSMLENVCWHLEINNVGYDIERLKALLEAKKESDGMVSNTIVSSMMLIIF